VSVLLQHEPLLQADIACRQLKGGQETTPVVGSVVQPFRFANRDCAKAWLWTFSSIQLCRMTPVSVPMIVAAHTKNPSFRTNDRFSVDVAFRMSGPPRMCDARP
jgi:hypothetical protein